MQTLAIQQALQSHGFSIGKAGADGVWGRDSIAGLRAFQGANHLTVTGVPDTASLEALFGKRTTTAIASPVWYDEANRLLGLHESAGAANNPTILGWAREIGGWVAKFYTADSIPWCALFVSHCIGTTLPGERMPKNPLSAFSWANFGVSCQPAIGAICVFSRNGGGHVAFYAGEDETTIHTLGGNQSDAVTVTRIPKSRLTCFRWPTTAPAPSGGRVIKTASGTLSRSEA